MSTITKERIANLLQFNSEGSDCQANAEQWEVNELARIALASLEADKGSEPVAKVDTVGVCWYADNGVPRKPAVGTELFSAPQAPISVPDLTALDNLAGEMLNHAMNCERRVAVVYTHCAHRLAEEVRDLRAAMLQGADGNSPVIPDGWVACSDRMPESDDFVYIWPRPDFGVELHVAQYGKFDKRDAGWYAQVYEQNYGIEYYPIKVTHWMPLPAAPLQEVKP